MSQEKIKKIHLIYGCVAAVLILALGIALILSCLDIYNSGPRPYSPESIGLRFPRIAILVYSCIALALGGIILDLALPAEQKKPKIVKDELSLLKRLKEKAGILDEQTASAVKKEEKKRKIFRLTTAVVFIALMIYPAIYFLDGSHFTIESLNTDIRKAVCIALIPAMVGLILCYICSELERKSISRETELYKAAAAESKGTPAQAAPVKPAKKFNAVAVTRVVVLTVAVCFIVLGIYNLGIKDVFDKAVAICTECIGLG